MKRFFLTVLLILMSAAAFAQEPPQTNYEIDKLEGHEVQRYPTFRGGNPNKFAHWVTAHLVYPRDAKKKCIQGTVKVNFVVDVDGRVKDVEVVEGVCESLDAEAVRVVSSSPKWKCAIVDGEPSRVIYTIPVIFIIPE